MSPLDAAGNYLTFVCEAGQHEECEGAEFCHCACHDPQPRSQE